MDLSRRGNFNPSLGRYFPGCARHRLYCAAFSSSREEIVTFLLFCLILLYASCSVSGQLFFKHGMSDQVKSPRSRRLLDIAAGVSAMTVGFFVWLALLHRFDLSFLYPFEGLDRVLLALGAWLFLREKMTTDLWIGVILICLGTSFVSAS